VIEDITKAISRSNENKERLVALYRM